MKKEKPNSTLWLIGGLAALTFLCVGSIAAAQTVTSYNDLAWGAGQLNTNITTFTSPAGGSGLLSTGKLKNFDNGAATDVTLTVTGGTFDGTAQATQGANPTMGDAFTIFDGKVNGLGAISYISAGNPDLVLTFTDMSPNKVYDLTFFADRDANAWDRASLVTISGQDAFVNTSSVASDNPDTGNFPGGVIFTGPTSPVTRLPADNNNGYVARFSTIKSGSDGTVVLTISFDGSVPEQFKGKYASALRLIESGNTTNDIDGDGKADIVLRNMNTGDAGAWLGNGLTLGSTGLIAAGVAAEWVVVGNGDLDGDGKADIVLRNSVTGDVGVWLGNGLTLGSTGVIATGVAAEWIIVGLGDLDGDGKDDIVVRNTSTGDVGAWLGNGLTLGSTGIIATGVATEWVVAGLGDVNGDGKDDIVVRNTSTGDVGVWLGNGLTLGSTGVIAAGVEAVWVIVGLGDLDGDGKDDIVVRNTVDGSIGAWLGNGLTLGSTGVIAGPGTVWTVADIGDVNGDGKADIVLRNSVTGDVGVWLGNGLTLGSTGVIAAAVPLEWKIKP